MPAPDLLVLGRRCAWPTFVMADILYSSGALIAGTWAAMHYMGEEYVVRHQSCISSSLQSSAGTSHLATTLSEQRKPFNSQFKTLFPSCLFWVNHRLL
jgi:hypothetical protein